MDRRASRLNDRTADACRTTARRKGLDRQLRPALPTFILRRCSALDEWPLLRAAAQHRDCPANGSLGPSSPTIIFLAGATRQHIRAKIHLALRPRDVPRDFRLRLLPRLQARANGGKFSLGNGNRPRPELRREAVRLALTSGHPKAPLHPRCVQPFPSRDVYLPSKDGTRNA